MADNKPECKSGQDSTEQEINDILIVGFTGEVAYQYVRIRQRKKGDIYVENRYKPEGPHFSYHASGEMHEVYVDQRGKTVHSLTGTGPPIAQFRGEISLGGWTIYAPGLPIWKQFMPSKERKAQLIVRFDMTRLTGWLALSFRLIEIGRQDILETFLRSLQKMDVEVLGHVTIKDTNPWIVIVAAAV